MRGMLWRMGNDGMDAEVDKAVAYFKKKHGYAPRLLVGRQENLNGLHVRTDMEVRAGQIQRNHIVLYEVAKSGRIPVVYKGKRKPIT